MLHVIAIAEMFLVQNSARNQSKPKQGVTGTVFVVKSSRQAHHKIITANTMNTTIIAASRTAEDGEFPRFSFSFRIIFSAR